MTPTGSGEVVTFTSKPSSLTAELPPAGVGTILTRLTQVPPGHPESAVHTLPLLAPPSLTVTRTAAATVQLSWSAAHNEGQVKVQRKRSGESQWVDIFSGWHAPTDTAVDTAAGGIVAHRLLLRDPKGRFVFSAPLVTEA